MGPTSNDDRALEVHVVRSSEGDVVTVELEGDLDRGTSRRMCAAVALARRVAVRTVIIDAAALDFVDLGGYRSLLLACGNPRRGRPLNVMLVRGPALHRLQRLLAQCDPGSAEARAA